MQRSPFAPIPAQSPPLHHPVPQHVSTVPMMRSPPPPSSQSHHQGYENPYQPAPAQGGSGTFAPNFGGFINDPTAQMGFQVGKTAMMAGQEYMEQNVRLPKFSFCFFFPHMSSLTCYTDLDDADSSIVMFRFRRSSTTSMSPTHMY